MGIISKFKQFREKGSPNGQGDESDATPEKEMSFLDHLEELRWHLLRSGVAIFIFGIAFMVNIEWLIENVVLWPYKSDFPTQELLCSLRESLCFEKLPVSFLAISPYEQFIKSITFSFIAGFIIAFPYFIWEMWRFIKPGLRVNEVKGLRGNVVIISLLFFLGISFAYFVVLPFAIQFLANYQLAPGVENQWRIGTVVGMVAQVSFAGGILFEMPILVYYLTKIGLLSPAFMKKYRRHAIVVLLVLSAMITPPDVISQILIFLPLIILYQISIGICKRVYKKQQAEIDAM